MQIKETQWQNLPPEMANLLRFSASIIAPNGDKKPIKNHGINYALPKNYSDAKGAVHIAKTLGNGTAFAAFDICGYGKGENYLFIDFDHVLDENGEFVNTEAEDWYGFVQLKLNGYCELSASRTGIHIFAVPTPGKFSKIGGNKTNRLYFDAEKKSFLEVFYHTDSRKTCHMTGEIYDTAERTIAKGAVVDEVLAEILAAIAPPEAHAADEPAEQPARAELPADVQALVNAINHITPAALEQKGYLQRSEKGAPRPTGYICPYCGSGTHSNKTGAFTYYARNVKDNDAPHFTCHICHKGGDVLHLLAQAYGTDCRGKNFYAVLRKAADEFKIDYDPAIFERKTADETATVDVFAGELSKLNRQLSEWQRTNGDINPDVIPDLQDAVEYIYALTPETFTVTDTENEACLNKVALCLFYLPSVGEKFFATANAAKRRATAAIRRLEKKKPPKKPSKRVRALSELAITPIRRAVEPLAAQVQRTHRWYDMDRENKRRLKIQDYNEQERLANTTAKLINGCPADLILPKGVEFNDKTGISRWDWDKPAKFRARIAVCTTPIVPTAVYRAPGKHTTAYEVAIKSKGVWRRVRVDGDELADSKKILRLARDGGALIESSQHLCKYFAQIIKENEARLPEIKCYAQPGWTDKTFSTFAYPTGGEGYIVRRSGFDFEGEFGSAGDADEWKKYFLDACTNGGAPARIFLGTSLAAPLVRPLVVLNSQCHLDGRNNNGKSALNKLGASIYGNPLKLMRTFAATQKNLQSVAAACRDLPSFIDELETANKKMLDDLPTMVYDFAQGKTNQANKRNGDMREALEFSGTRLSTAERPILKKQDQRGAFKRLVQIHCDTLFDEDFGTDLHYVTENNYGHFGRPWVEFVTVHLKEIKTTYHDMFKLAAARKFNVEKTLLKSVVAASVSLQYFFICIGAKDSFDDKAAAEDIVAVIATLPTPADMDESTRALDDLRGRFAEKIKYFTREGDGTPGDASTFRDSGGDPPAATYDTYGKIFRNGEVAILPTVLRRWIENDLGYASLEPIAADWARKGLLHVGKGKGTGLRCQVRLNGDRQWAYRFNANVLSESDETEI